MGERTFQHSRVRMIEPHVLAHGPSWMGFMGGAFSRVCEELTIVHPDVESYALAAEAAEKWRAPGGAEIRFEPFTPDPDNHRMPVERTLARACEPGADLSLITFVDQTVWGPRHLPKALDDARPPIWGVWFEQIRPEIDGLRHRLRRLYDPRAQFEGRSLRAQKRPPEWLDGVFFMDDALRERTALRCPGFVLPDPWATRPRLEQSEARRQLGLPLGAPIYLHFGIELPRKGLQDTIEAWDHAPEDAVLLRAGDLRPENVAPLGRLTEQGRAIHHDGWIPAELADVYIRAVDWVLLPYRGHEGSSGVLAAAAAAQRPVIAADFGLIGRNVRRAGLGLLFEHRSVASLADALRASAARPISDFAAPLDAFAEAHALPAFEAALLAPFMSEEA